MRNNVCKQREAHATHREMTLPCACALHNRCELQGMDGWRKGLFFFTTHLSMAILLPPRLLSFQLYSQGSVFLGCVFSVLFRLCLFLTLPSRLGLLGSVFSARSSRLGLLGSVFSARSSRLGLLGSVFLALSSWPCRRGSIEKGETCSE